MKIVDWRIKMKRRAVLFGAVGGGKRLFEPVSENYEVVYFVDNDASKWGKHYMEKKYILHRF